MSSSLFLEQINEFTFVEDVNIKDLEKTVERVNLKITWKDEVIFTKNEMVNSLIAIIKDVIYKHELETMEVIAQHETKMKDVAAQLEAKVK